MGMFNFRLTPDDGETIDVVASMRDVRMWEKTHKGRSLGQLSDGAGISATILYELGFTAAKRGQSIPSGLTEDDFADRYDLEVETDEQTAARTAAVDLKARIEAGAVESGEDPTPPAL